MFLFYLDNICLSILYNVLYNDMMMGLRYLTSPAADLCVS